MYIQISQNKASVDFCYSNRKLNESLSEMILQLCFKYNQGHLRMKIVNYNQIITEISSENHLCKNIKIDFDLSKSSYHCSKNNEEIFFKKKSYKCRHISYFINIILILKNENSGAVYLRLLHEWKLQEATASIKWFNQGKHSLKPNKAYPKHHTAQ